MSPNELHDLLAQLGVQKIRQRSNNLTGLCPFHEERTPSWGISLTEPHLYGCFGCQAKGSLLYLLMKIGKWSYGKASTFLGVKSSSAKDIDSLGQPSSFKEAGPDPADLYPYFLGKPARKYLYSRGITLRTSTETGLLYAHDLDRLVFPWYFEGKLAVVTGRTLKRDAKTEGKGIPLFGTTKVATLYLPARKIVSGPLILVEGEIDALKVYQAGFKNVGALGHGLITKKQEALIKNSPATELILFFDNDKAGHSITEAAIKKFTGVKELGKVDYSKFRSKFKDPAEFPDSLLRRAIGGRQRRIDWIEI